MSSNATTQKTKVGLVQIGEMNRPYRQRRSWYMKGGIPLPKPYSRSSQISSAVYLPYSVGLLQAYAQKYSRTPEQHEFLPPIYKPLEVEQGVQQLSRAHIVGFSAYIWNIRLSLEIADALKECCPSTLIIFGGPQVPDHAEEFLRSHPFIDIVCHGEGEQVFLQILEKYASGDWTSIPSVM